MDSKHNTPSFCWIVCLRVLLVPREESIHLTLLLSTLAQGYWLQAAGIIMSIHFRHLLPSYKHRDEIKPRVTWPCAFRAMVYWYTSATALFCSVLQSRSVGRSKGVRWAEQGGWLAYKRNQKQRVSFALPLLSKAIPVDSGQWTILTVERLNLRVRWTEGGASQKYCHLPCAHTHTTASSKGISTQLVHGRMVNLPKRGSQDLDCGRNCDWRSLWEWPD